MIVSPMQIITGTQTAATVGSTKIPTITTFNGHAVIGAESEPIRVWGGTTATIAAGTLTCTATDPQVDEHFHIGSETYTFKTTRSLPFEVTIHATAATQAEYIVNAITADSTIVTAARDNNDVDLTASIPGEVGEYGLVTSSAGVTVSGATMTRSTAARAGSRPRCPSG